MNIRLGVVSYLNTKPLVYALEQNLVPHRFELVYDVPSICARKLAGGEIDLAILPSIEYARSDGYEIVPEVGITCDGPVKSGLLVSKRPIEDVRTIALDTSSRTTVALARILMRRIHGFSGDFVDHPPDLDRMLGAADAAVLIGDIALHVDFSGLRAWDLGQLWRDETGLPFVFAFWAGRPGALGPEDAALLVECKRIGARNVDRIAAEFAIGRPLPASFYASYLTQNIQYDLDKRQVEGLRTFYATAAQAGLIGGEPCIRFCGTR